MCPFFYSSSQTVFATIPPSQGGVPMDSCERGQSGCPTPTPAPEELQQKQLAAAQTRNESGQPPNAGILTGGESETRSNFSFFMSISILLGGIFALIALLRQRLENRSVKSGGKSSKKWNLVFKPQFALSAFALLFVTAIVGSVLTKPLAVSAEKPDNPKRLNKSGMTGAFNPSNKPVFKTAQNIGGDGATQIGAPIFDAAGNRYVRGGFTGNMTIGANNLQASRYFDAFLAKYDANGNALWARQATGATGGITFYNSIEGATGLAVDANGNVYIGGSFVKTITFQGGANASVTLSDNGAAGVNYEAFLAKYDANGNLIWARGGNSGSPKNQNDLEIGQNNINQIVVDAAGNPYITGVFSGSNFFGSAAKNNGKRDIFAARINPLNGAVVWKQIIGGADEDGGTDLEIDAANNVYLIGKYDSETIVFPTDPATVLSNTKDSTSTFIAKFNSSGANLRVTSIGNSNNVGGSQIVANPAGEIFVTGYFNDYVEFGETILYEKEGKGDDEAGLGGYVAKMNTKGEFVWAEGFGGLGTNLALDAAGRVYVLGRFYDGGVFGYKSPNEETLASFGGEDVFVARYDANGGFEWAKPIAGNGQEGTILIGHTADSNVLTTNYYNPLGISYNPARGTIFISGDFQNAVALDCNTLTAPDTTIHSYIAEISADFEETSCRIWNGLDDDDNDFDSPDNWNGGVVPAANDSVFAPYTGNDFDPPTFNPAKNIPLSNVSLADNRILTLAQELNITNRLDLIGGFVDAENYPLYLGEQAQTFAIAEGLVLGRVQKQFPAGYAGSFVFPVGTADNKYYPEYSPVTLSNISGAGSFSVTANRGEYPNQADNLPLSRAARWWNLTNGGLQSADITFKYLDADVDGKIENRYRAYRIPTGGGNAVQIGSSIDTERNTVTAPNVAQFSDWTLAESLIPTAASASVSGRVLTANGLGISQALVTMTDAQGNQRQAMTNAFGYYRFEGVATGATYVFSAKHKKWITEPITQIQSVHEDRDDLDFIAPE